jgi:hypothetical protein
VSNIHTAERIIECNSNIYEWQAPWRIEFPQVALMGYGFCRRRRPATIRG